MLVEEALGEAHVPRFFGHVDLHDFPQQRMHALARRTQQLAVLRVDEQLAAQHGEEKLHGARATCVCHHVADACIEATRRLGHEVCHHLAAIDELLKHLHVPCFLDHFVHRVAELLRTVAQGLTEFEQAS